MGSRLQSNRVRVKPGRSAVAGESSNATTPMASSAASTPGSSDCQVLDEKMLEELPGELRAERGDVDAVGRVRQPADRLVRRADLVDDGQDLGDSSAVGERGQRVDGVAGRIGQGRGAGGQRVGVPAEAPHQGLVGLGVAKQPVQRRDRAGQVAGQTLERARAHRGYTRPKSRSIRPCCVGSIRSTST